jgi:hypothetical protein
MKPVMMMLLALLCVGGIALAQDTTYDYARGVNFASFHTYTWVDIPGGNVHPSQLVDGQIKSAIDSVLATKGLTKVAPGQPADLDVGYQVAVDQERQWNAWGGGGWRMGMGMGSATSSTISNGTLVFDMYDVANKQQVWTSRATKVISPSSNADKNYKNLQKSAQKMLKNYPPK